MRMYECMCICVYICVYVYVCVYTCVYLYVCVGGGAVPSKYLTIDFVLVFERLCHAWKSLLEITFRKEFLMGCC
jgi:hypothetical protein